MRFMLENTLSAASLGVREGQKPLHELSDGRKCQIISHILHFGNRRPVLLGWHGFIRQLFAPRLPGAAAIPC